MRVQEINVMNKIQPNQTAGRKKKKKSKGKRPWLRFFMAAVLFLALLVVLALSPLFTVTRVDIRGNYHYGNDYLLSVSGITTGKNAFKSIGSNIKSILTFRYGEAEKKIISSCPYVKSATVRLHLPGTIKINIVERTPEFLVPYLGTNLLMDKEGYIVDNVERTENILLPLITGLKFEGYKLGQKLDLKNKDALELCVRVKDALAESDKGSDFKISSVLNGIDVSDAKNITILLDSRIRVNLGDLEDLAYRIRFMKEIYQKNIKKSEKGLLDFTKGDPHFLLDN